MSIKGLGKSMARTPQQFKQRFNIGDITKDAIFIDAERRFDELEKETKKLHDESKKYFDAINGTLQSCEVTMVYYVFLRLTHGQVCWIIR